MEALFRFLVTYEGLIYILLALGGLVAVRWLIKSLNEWRQAIFGLERAFARQRLVGSLVSVGLILSLAVIQFVVTTFVASSLPYSTFEPTPTLDPLAGPGVAFPLDLATGDAVPSPTMALASGQGCIPDQIAFTSPQPGQEVSMQVSLLGVINVPNFGFYKYEMAPAGMDNWATISAGRSVGENGELGLWDTSALIPGDYLLRLVVTDNEGQELPPCVISVRVKEN